MTTEAAPITFRARKLPRASVGLVFRRLLRWSLATGRFVARLVGDQLRGRRGLSQVGIRLRQAFEEVGGTAVKLGQQLSIRVDMVPFEVCAELARLNDQAAPFPFEQAMARVEATTGRPLAETFRRVEPEPIGAASIAVVYLGELLDGERVAIKVQRPEVARSFAADLSCFDLMCGALEGFAVVKPGTFKALRNELRTMLLEELDFVSEARFQRLFRREARKAGIDWLIAPRVHHALCGEDVIVSEFAWGIPCSLVVKAVESEDEEALRLLRSLGIDPKLLGERVWRMSHWSKYESLLFHADPHPGNILVRPGNQLVFLDFGACGGMTERTRYDQRHIVLAVTQSDFRGMANSVLEDVMPMPHVDVESVRRDLDRHFVQFVRGVRDPRAEWWERCTAQIFVGFLQVTQSYDMPVPLDLLRIVRSTLLYDTLAARLHRRLSDKVFLSYLRQRSRRLAKRFAARASRVGLPDASGAPGEHLSLERILDWTVVGLETLSLRQAAVAKGAAAARAALELSALATLWVLGVLASLLASDPTLWRRPGELASATLEHPATLGLSALALIFVRRARYRLEDRDA